METSELEHKLQTRTKELRSLAKELNVHFLKVVEIHTRYSAKIYQRENIKEIYNNEVEDRIFAYTERYLERFGSKCRFEFLK